MSEEKRITVTARLSPKMRYGLELLRRKKKQNLQDTLEQILKDAVAGRFGEGV